MYKYWVTKGYSTVKKILGKCTVCRKAQGGPFVYPAMGPLPEERITRSIPFKNTGLDMIGYLYYKDTNGTTQKIWLIIFCDLAIRAIHLELVRSQSVKDFIMALRRFFAKFTHCNLIISDRAPTFFMADKVLTDIWDKVVHNPEVKSYVASIKVKWRFVPNFGPYSGGVFERCVKLFKSSFVKAHGD